MNALRKKNLASLARAYWQPLVLALLILLIALEGFAWMSKWIELRKVDRIIAKAESPQTAEGTPTPSPQQETGQPQPGKEAQPPKPLKNIFKQENINYQLSAIYMDQAVINGNPYKIGDNIGKAVLKEIGIFEVKIQEDGNENLRTLTLFTSQGGEEVSPSSPSNNAPRREPRTGGGGGPRPPQPMGLQGPGGRGGGFREQFQNMPEAERQQMRDRVRAMSPDDRRRFFEQMRNQG